MVAYPFQEVRGTHGISEQNAILRVSPSLFRNVSSFLADKIFTSTSTRLTSLFFPYVVVLPSLQIKVFNNHMLGLQDHF